MKEIPDKKTRELIEALKFNHNIQDDSFTIDVFVPEEELDLYRSRITHLTLPRRFGMYKT